jgi:hypothetical protein
MFVTNVTLVIIYYDLYCIQEELDRIHDLPRDCSVKFARWLTTVLSTGRALLKLQWHNWSM